MKYLSLTFLLLLMTCFSCQQEEVLPLESISEESGVVSRLKKKCPAPTITLSPCGYGFKFNINRSGSVDLGSYNYIIQNNATGVTVDSGIISNGMNTSWVLSPCTLYDVTIYDWCVGPVTITVTSDGCGGLFLC